MSLFTYSPSFTGLVDRDELERHLMSVPTRDLSRLALSPLEPVRLFDWSLKMPNCFNGPNGLASRRKPRTET